MATPSAPGHQLSPQRSTVIDAPVCDADNGAERLGGRLRSDALADPCPVSSVAAVIPVGQLCRAKSRLRMALDPASRRELVLGMLFRTIEATRTVRTIERVIVVSPDRTVQTFATQCGVHSVAQRGTGLNEGVTQAVRSLPGTSAAVLVIPVDLAFVSALELAQALRWVGHATATDPHRPCVAVVPDRHSIGTNLLYVSPPNAITFRFGEGSRTRHAAEAARIGAKYIELAGSLSLDLDTPEDLDAAIKRGVNPIAVLRATTGLGGMR